MISTRFLVSGFGRLVRVGGDGGLTGFHTSTLILLHLGYVSDAGGEGVVVVVVRMNWVDGWMGGWVATLHI